MATSKRERNFIRIKSDRDTPRDKRDRLPPSYEAGPSLKDAMDEYNTQDDNTDDLFV